MEADPIPKVFRSFSNVLLYQFFDIQKSGVAQSNNINCSVVPPMGDVRSPYQIVDAVFPTPGDSPEDSPDAR